MLGDTMQKASSGLSDALVPIDATGESDNATPDYPDKLDFALLRIAGVCGLACIMARNSQILWIGGRQATSDTGVSGEGSGVMSTGRSRSLPLWNSAPARTSATSCGALTARHRDCAASISL